MTERSRWEYHCQGTFGRTAAQQAIVVSMISRYMFTDYQRRVREWIVEQWHVYKTPKRIGNLRLLGTWWFPMRYWAIKGPVSLTEALHAAKERSNPEMLQRVINLRTGQVVLM